MLSRSVEKLVEGNIVLCKRLLQEIQSPLVDEQVISIWNICSIGYEIKDLPSGKIKEFRGILRELLKYCNKGLGLLLRIYIFSPALFNRLHSLPKFKGYINIKLKCNYVYL